MDAEGSFSETQEITDDRPIRQGDIFEWLSKPTDPWKSFGIVVTADCDIAQEKHSGIISYIPILPISDYLGLFYLPKLAEKSTRPLSAELRALIRRYQAQNDPTFSEPISDTAADSWILRTTPDEVANDLKITGKDKIRFIEIANIFRSTTLALQSGDFFGLVDTIILARSRQSNHEKAREAFWTDIQNYIERLPGDAFFIGSIAQGQGGGFVAHLRLVREVRQGEIAIRYSDLRDSSVHARRLARLSSPYVYRLTQQLGNVFASIGLPNAYEANRRACVTSLSNKVTTAHRK